jgi:hypothetical protein
VPKLWERIRRRIQVEKNLFFDYEVSPHRAFLAKRETRLANIDASSQSESQLPSKESSQTRSSPMSSSEEADLEKFGAFVPFKQVRLQGQINPLRPPIHVETVLIGRALGQPTGYRFGIGFRIRDDGYVEAEFVDGVRKYISFDEFELDIATRVKAAGSDF